MNGTCRRGNDVMNMERTIRALDLALLWSRFGPLAEGIRERDVSSIFLFLLPPATKEPETRCVRGAPDASIWLGAREPERADGLGNAKFDVGTSKSYKTKGLSMKQSWIAAVRLGLAMAAWMGYACGASGQRAAPAGAVSNEMFLAVKNGPAIHREPDVPNWSNPALEDHKDHRLLVVGTPELFAAGTKTFFGDVHVHSNFSADGRPNNTDLAEKIRWARDVAHHDFIINADHIEHILAENTYEAYTQTVEAANQPGRFVTIPSYEWRSRGHPAQAGHRIVMFRDAFGPAFGGSDTNTDTPRKLNAALRRLGVPVIASRHHPGYLNNWNNFDQEMEPVTEIFSSAGNCEYDGGPLARPTASDRPVLPGNYVQDALIRGYLTGFVSGGDVHLNMPGECGLTGVVAPELTRGALWDAIRARRCYATTGVKILLDFSVNGYPMGTVLRVPTAKWADLYPMRIACAAIGTANMASIEVIENNRVIYTHTMWRGPADQMGFCLPRPLERTPYWRYYYVRVTQKDGHMAWSSPVWILFTEEEEAE